MDEKCGGGVRVAHGQVSLTVMQPLLQMGLCGVNRVGRNSLHLLSESAGWVR